VRFVRFIINKYGKICAFFSGVSGYQIDLPVNIGIGEIHIIVCKKRGRPPIAVITSSLEVKRRAKELEDAGGYEYITPQCVYI